MCHWGKSHSAAMALRKLRASDRQQQSRSAEQLVSLGEQGFRPPKL
jgi:hypothetical protein